MWLIIFYCECLIILMWITYSVFVASTRVSRLSRPPAPRPLWLPQSINRERSTRPMLARLYSNTRSMSNHIIQSNIHTLLLHKCSDRWFPRQGSTRMLVLYWIVVNSCNQFSNVSSPIINSSVPVVRQSSVGGRSSKWGVSSDELHSNSPVSSHAPGQSLSSFRSSLPSQT